MLVIRKDIQLYFSYELGETIKEIEIPLIPESVGYSYTPNFAAATFLGRVSPIYQYTGGSDETYTFTLTIHTDALEGSTHKDIVSLVDAIKSLSYPTRTNGIISFPKVYFQLGELAGTCTVVSSIQWKKPIVTEHYAVATIDFTITMIRSMRNVNKTVVETKSDTGNQLSNIDQVYSGLSSDEYKKYRDLLNQGGFDTSVIDFVVGGSDSLRDNFNNQEAVKKRDYSMERLNNLYGIFATTDGSNKVDSLLGWANTPTLSTKGSNVGLLGNNNKYKSTKKIKKDIDKYLEHYYKVVNTNITRAELDQIKKEMYSLIDTIEKSQGEVIKYAASK